MSRNSAKAEVYVQPVERERPFITGQHHFRYLRALQSVGVPSATIGQAVIAVLAEESAEKMDKVIARVLEQHRSIVASMANFLDLNDVVDDGFSKLVDESHQSLERRRR